VSSIEYPDGRKDTYSYEKGVYTSNPNPDLNQFTPDANGTAERVTVVHGTTMSPNGIAYKTTKEVTVRDQYGNQVLQEAYVYNGTDYERIIWAVTDYDGRGHVVISRNHKGETITAVWTGEQRMSDIDAVGIETVYEYDSLNRIKKQTKKGIAAGGGFPAQPDIVTIFEYDAEGRQKKDTLGEGNGSLIGSKAYDRAGRLMSETDAAGLSTTYSYANGGRTQTITRPGGATGISDKYIDGQPKSVTGTAVVPRYFDYGVNVDGTRYTQEFTGSAGLSSPRWTKTTNDWVDRTVAVEKPSFSGANLIQTSIYNSLGQLQKQTITANTTKLIADKLYEYDQLGQQIRSGSDIDASGTLTLISTDHLIETDTLYEKVGNDWFRVTSTRTYLTNSNDSPVIQTERERLNNFPLNGTEQTNSEVTIIDFSGNSTKTTTTIDRPTKKQISITDTPDSTISAVTITVNGLLQSSNPTTQQSSTTYSYDSLGRPITVTDPGIGTASRTYNSSGQLEFVTEGAGNTTYEYYDTKHMNAGRLKAQTNAAGKKIYFNYNNRGEMRHIHWNISTMVTVSARSCTPSGAGRTGQQVSGLHQQPV
jgi:YD repeat-containing protein